MLKGIESVKRCVKPGGGTKIMWKEVVDMT